MFTSPPRPVKTIDFDEKTVISTSKYLLEWENGLQNADTQATVPPIGACLPAVELSELMELYSENVVAKIWRIANSYIKEHVCHLYHTQSVVCYN